MSSLGASFPFVYTGNPFTVLDTYNTALYNNGANMPLGTIVNVPLPAYNVGTTPKGAGSYLVAKYLRYLSTANPATVAGPAPVYYVDETFETVSGVESEGLGVNFIAGWMLPSTATTSIGSTFTATALNGNFVFVGLSGYIPAAISVTATAVGDALIGASGNFTVARVAAGTAPTNRVLGWALTAVSGGLSDVIAAVSPVF